MQHALDRVTRHIAGHVVVNTATGQNDLRVVAHLLGFMREVIRVHANAVAADHAGAKRQKVPFAACGFEHVERVNAQALENHREFVHQRNVQVALGVFNHLGGFGHFEAGRLVRAGGDDAEVKRIHGVGHLGRAAAGDFLDFGEGVDLVAGVDALGAVAAEEPLVERQAAELFQHRHADFFGGAGVDGGFINHHRALRNGLAHGFAGLDQGREVGPVGLVHGRGHGDDEDLAVFEIFGVAAEVEAVGRLHVFRSDFERAVLS